MIKVLGFIFTIGASIALVMGVLSAFGVMAMGVAQWPMIILGVIFFFAGIGLLKNKKDTDVIKAENDGN